jgi:hypothetical protein
MLRLTLFATHFIVIFLFLIKDLSGQCSENISITTDRDIYFPGETLWYKINCLKTGTNQSSDLSKVSYIELLNIKNTPVFQLKLFLKEGQGNSRIILPDTLSTGNYILRGYTNWMKNFGSEVISVKVISVINPFQNNVFAGIDRLNTQLSENSENEKTYQFSLSQIKSEYKTRSQVDFNMKGIGGLRGISVSVAKAALIAKGGKATLNMKSNDSILVYEKPGSREYRIKFLPGIEGDIISGTVRKKTDNSPLINKVMTLGFVGRVPSFYLSKTDSSGKFRFVINQFGAKEMVIQPLSADTVDFEFSIELDPQFTVSRNNISYIGKSADDSFIDEINKSIVSMQVESIYNLGSKRNQFFLPVSEDYCFYGDPEVRVTLEKYIELPTLSEVFKEIVPMVGIKGRAENYTFRVISSQGILRNSIALVDGIYIKDVNRILAMNPEDVKQIDVINLSYYLQDQELGGIISIQTKTGNLSAMNFDNRIFRQEFTGYEYSYNYSSPDYLNDSVRSSPVADFRNLLYWKPDVKADEKGTADIKFFTSDDTGKYLIILQGIDNAGKLRRFEVPFSVVD